MEDGPTLKSQFQRNIQKTDGTLILLSPKTKLFQQFQMLKTGIYNSVTTPKSLYIHEESLTPRKGLFSRC